MNEQKLNYYKRSPVLDTGGIPDYPIIPWVLKDLVLYSTTSLDTDGYFKLATD